MNDLRYQFAEPESSQSLDQCWFYHTMDIPGLGTVPGHWDLRGKFNEYIGGLDIRGRSFLDVGVASGFLLFEAEKAGASVTGFDAASVTQYQIVPGRGASDNTDGFRRMRNGFWTAYNAFNSKGKIIYGD